jgi:squalene-hopene/tetraprenyl-beta-curcumene cyclase
VIEAFCNQPKNAVQTSLKRGLAYLRASQHADGSWSNSDGRQRILYTSQAIRALLTAGAFPDDDAIAAAVNWLIVEQQANGGWCEASNEPNTDGIRSSSKRKTSALQTAWALMTLVAAGRMNDPVTRRGVDFLLDSQGDDGGWTDREWTSYDPASKRWFSNDLHSIAWPLWALSSWAVAAGSAESEPASQLSLRLMDAVAEN